MHEIDFLPEEYRKNNTRRRQQSWKVLLLGAIVPLILASFFIQRQQQTKLQAALTALEGDRLLAVTQRAALTDLQSRLGEARAEAELFTYLKHPWPRTRIIAALVDPLPDEITFDQLHIYREAAAGNRSPFVTQSEQKDLESLPPAARDLSELRDRYDAGSTVVSLSGTTTESDALYRYLAELDREPLFAEISPPSTEFDSLDGQPRLRFEVRLTVRSGYGQPGGPTGSQTETSDRVPLVAGPPV